MISHPPTVFYYNVYVDLNKVFHHNHSEGDKQLHQVWRDLGATKLLFDLYNVVNSLKSNQIPVYYIWDGNGRMHVQNRL